MAQDCLVFTGWILILSLNHQHKSTQWSSKTGFRKTRTSLKKPNPLGLLGFGLHWGFIPFTQAIVKLVG